MTEYYVPTGPGEAEYVEKRSKFMGKIRPVESEEAARAFVDEMKKKYHDARHNCWCYALRNGVMRYSDDGEPQGTAGQPMLGVFQKEGVTNVCCVVTRYFGGILLGAGGLVRAYTQASKLALDESGISVVRRWVEVTVDCPYNFFERVKLEVTALNGVVGDVDYTDHVTVHALLPEGQEVPFGARITEISAGGFSAVEVGEAFKAVPLA